MNGGNTTLHPYAGISGNMIQKTVLFNNLTNKQVEDRYPVLSVDDNTLYFLSERFGDFNVCQMSVDNPQNIKQLTHFSKHPVRFLSRSKDDILCFFYDGEIYTLNRVNNLKNYL